MRGVEAADVEGGIGLGIALRLRLLQHVGEAPALALHQRQNVVAGAVEDAVDAADIVALEALAYDLDDGNAAGHRALEIERDLVLLGQRGKSGPMLGEQRLVGGHHMLAGAERGLDRLLGHAAFPADQLDEHVDVRVLGESDRVRNEAESRNVGVAVFAPVLGRDGDDLNFPPGTRGKLGPARLEEPQEAAPDGADTGQSELQSVTHGKRSERPVRLGGNGNDVV